MYEHVKYVSPIRDAPMKKIALTSKFNLSALKTRCTLHSQCPLDQVCKSGICQDACKGHPCAHVERTQSAWWRTNDRGVYVQGASLGKIQRTFATRVRTSYVIYCICCEHHLCMFLIIVEYIVHIFMISAVHIS